MNKFILSVGFVVTFPFLCFASYEIDFLIGETKNTQPLTTSFRLDLSSNHLSEKSKILDEEELKKEKIIGPSQNVQIKIKEEKDIPSIKTQGLCDFFNQTDEEKKNNPYWQSIILEAQLDEETWEKIPLYWAHLGSSVFVGGNSKNFLLSAFQRNLAKKTKEGTYQYTIEIGLIRK